MQGNKNIPELRFPEFEGEWEEKKLSQINKITMGQSPSSKYYTKNQNDTILVQGNQDIANNYVIPRIYTSKITKIAKKGEILLTVRAPVGDIVITQYDVCIGRGICSIKPSISTGFMFFYLAKLNSKNQWNKYIQGSTFESINSKDIKSMKIKIPKSSKEQEKIANFLTCIDQKISFMEKKLNFWKKLKEYYITRILNHTSKYKIRNVENIIKVIGSKKYQIKKTEIKNKGKYVVVDQSKDYIAGFHNDKNKVFFDIPIIIFGDHTTVLKYIEKPFIVGGDGVKILKPKIDINLKYLYYNLISNNIHSEGYKRHFGILKKKDIKIINDKKIQKTIGDLLYNIDRIIKYRSSKLKQLKYFKKGLLQKMFC